MTTAIMTSVKVLVVHRCTPLQLQDEPQLQGRRVIVLLPALRGVVAFVFDDGVGQDMTLVILMGCPAERHRQHHPKLQQHALRIARPAIGDRCCRNRIVLVL